MDYPVKILSQLRPILKGFRKSRGLTQAALAEKLGITQQSYAQFEANPESGSVERLFKILSMLGAELVLKEADITVKNEALFTNLQLQGEEVLTEIAKQKISIPVRENLSTSGVHEPSGKNYSVTKEDW